MLYFLAAAVVATVAGTQPVLEGSSQHQADPSHTAAVEQQTWDGTQHQQGTCLTRFLFIKDPSSKDKFK